MDPDGFFHGQISNRLVASSIFNHFLFLFRVGLVPSNMVIEIAKDDLMPRRPIAAIVGPTEVRREEKREGREEYSESITEKSTMGIIEITKL